MTWTWHGDPLYRYRNDQTGRFASQQEIWDWGEDSMESNATATKPLAVSPINVSQWQQDMRDRVKAEYIRQYELGKGGRSNMTAQDWGSVGGMIADQYRYLDDFAEEIAAGKLSSAQIAMRSQMYILSAREAYERASGRVRGLPDMPEYPGSGNTQCFFWGDKVRVLTQEWGFIRLASVKAGEHVLSHTGKYRKVLDTVAIKVKNGLAVVLDIAYGDVNVKCAVTTDHLFMVDDGWVEACNLVVGDSLGRMGITCEYCDATMVLGSGARRFCSLSCSSRGVPRLDNAHAVVRDLYSKGEGSLQRWHRNTNVEVVSAACSNAGHISHLKHPRNGKTYEELWGEHVAMAAKKKLSQARSGMTWEEVYGEDKAQQLRVRQRDRWLGKTLEQLWGDDVADRVKRQRSERASKPFDERYGDAADDIRKRISETVKQCWEDGVYLRSFTLEDRYGEERAAKMKRAISERTKRQWCENYDRMYDVAIANLKLVPYSMTTPELAMMDILDDVGVEYNEQASIGAYRVDFLLPNHNIVLEVDGDYWHNLPGAKERDELRDVTIMEKGYDVIRFWESEIVDDPIAVQDELERIIANHEGCYVLEFDARIENIEYKRMSGIVRCLVVEGDSSFVVTNGLVSHNCLTNCRCRWDYVWKPSLNIWECTWEMNPTKESCVDCIENAGKWNPYVVELGEKGRFVTIEGKPVFIGGPGQGGGGGSGSAGSDSDVEEDAEGQYVWRGEYAELEENIRAKGIRGKSWDDRPKSVYMTTSEREAHEYGMMKANDKNV